MQNGERARAELNATGAAAKANPSGMVTMPEKDFETRVPAQVTPGNHSLPPCSQHRLPNHG
jgi:hypothetical protein